MNLNKIFTSHMVFPANKPIRIFGEGSGIAKVCFGGVCKEIKSKGDSWIVEFEPMEYGGPYEIKIFLNGIETVIDDIYIGEVYLFSGQSNMQFKLKDANKSQTVYNPGTKVRFYVLDRLEKGEYYNSNNGWLVCDDDISQNLSALAYLTSCKVAHDKNIAIGAVCCYQGASVIESWVPKDAFKNIGIDIPCDKKNSTHTCEEYSAWNGESCLYNNMFLKIVPFSFSAVIWYQGEADHYYEEAKVYDKELAALINTWRTDLNDDKLPFIVIQLADYDYESIDKQGWAAIQQSQLNVMNICSLVKTVICRDVCENNDLHPPTKDKLAVRIAEALT